jgi:hypothetical protein
LHITLRFVAGFSFLKESNMKEAQAKKQLSRMLQSFTVGAVLQLLSELFNDSASRAMNAGDQNAFERAKEVTAALYVFGIGVDAIPRVLPTWNEDDKTIFDATRLFSLKRISEGC